MNRPPNFPQTVSGLELKEAAFTAPPANLDFTPVAEPANTPFQIEWDDFDTGTLDD